MSEKPNTDHYVRSINEVEPNNNGNVDIAVATSHNIFEVFSMLSTETPNGALPLWTGQWINGCNTLFPEFWNRALVLQSAGAIRVVDNATYESELTTYGETGAFVIDTTNHNIRLPKIVNFLRGISDLSSIGTPQGDAIRNLTGKAYPMFDGSSPQEGGEYTGTFRKSTGTFSSEIKGAYWGVGGENSGNSSTIATGELIFDASNVVPTSDENRPKNISCAMFIQVYNAVSDMSSINVSELVSRVTTLETDVSNHETNTSIHLTNEDRSSLNNNGIITKISEYTANYGITKTCPTGARWARCSGRYTGTGDNNMVVTISGYTVFSTSLDDAYSGRTCCCLVPINPGQEISVEQNGGGTNTVVYRILVVINN